MTDRSVIVVTVDGLGAAMLGPYGNSWVSTPGFDRLAAESLVIEHAWSDSAQLETTFRAYWQGRHAACAHPPAASLAQLCRDRGITPILLSDEQAVLGHEAARSFDKEHLIIEESAEFAQTPEGTIAAHFFEQALRNLSEAQPPFLLWIHARGFARAWDCPVQMRHALLDDTDPQLPDILAPPAGCGEPLDPDDAWGLRVAYAAQLNLWDACLHLFLEQLLDVYRHLQTLTVVTSPRGYPLGEHRQVGNAETILHGEQLHVPLIIRGLEPDFEPQRTQAICQSACVFGTVDRWLSLGADRQSTGGFALCADTDPADTCWQRAVAISPDRSMAALRTAGWYFRRQPDPARPLGLYVKPDDRWEFNEVADRMPEVVAAAEADLSQFLELAAAERLNQLPHLPDTLRDVV